jgi:carbamoyl-phosphate synthase large subunit
MRSVNVLVTSAGTASGVSVIKALRRQNEFKVRLLAVDANPFAAGLYLADDFAIVPKCADHRYLGRVFELCEQHEIEAVFPIYSQEIEALAAQAGPLAARGVRTLLAGPDIVSLCNDKTRMYDLVARLGIPIPKIVNPLSMELRFPLFAKPVTATGGDGAMRIMDQAALDCCRAQNPRFIYQEFLEGREYTVDILCDRQSDLVVCSPRLRLSVKAGQSVKGRTARVPRLEELARTICKELGMVGPCNLQFFETGGDHVFLELNPRFPAGGLILTVAAGANIPFLALKLMLDHPVARPVVRSGLTMLRYWEEIILGEDGKPISVAGAMPEPA